MNDLPLPPLPNQAMIGLDTYRGGIFGYTDEQLEDYARTYGRMVQERCAQICEGLADPTDAVLDEAVDLCAAAIRANKETP
jgi:hypothetical protein